MKSPGSRLHPQDAQQASRGMLRRAWSLVLWWVTPGVVIAGVIGYFVLAAVNSASPPLLAVSGRSMIPTIVTGELVVVRGVQPSDLKVGDVIALVVPETAQEQYDLPSHVVHRIVKIEDTPVGLVFATKGDGNTGNDVFQTFPESIVGQVVGHLPYLGYPILFATSPQGMIFLASVALVALLYFVLGLLEGWRGRQEGTAHSVNDLLDEITDLKRLLSQLTDRIDEDPARMRDAVVPIAREHRKDADDAHA